MQLFNKVFKTDLWIGLVSISPLIFIFFLVSFWEPLFTSVPDKNDLELISGESIKIGKRHSIVKYNNQNIKVSYDCLCNYGWGEKSFKNGDNIYGLGEKADDGYILWSLKIADNEVINFEKLTTDKIERKTEAKKIAIPGMILSSLLMIQLFIQRSKIKKEEKSNNELFDILDKVADSSEPDSTRLSYLKKVIIYDADIIVDPLVQIAMDNTNSDILQKAIGKELGALWNNMDAQELEVIKYIQPSAKQAAVKELKGNNYELVKNL